MAAVCGCSQEQQNFIVLIGSISSATALTSAGFTWLVSDISQPLVGGVLGAVSVVAAAIASIVAIDVFKKDAIVGDMAFFVTQVVAPVALSLAATGLGFPVSIPLSLLLAAANIAVSIIVLRNLN
jgi:hypothetical protein